MDILPEEERIINFIKDLVKKSNAKGILVGLSGGIDSATTAALCKRAIGKEKVLALILPCHSNNNDLKDAKFVASHLEIEYKTVDLCGIFDAFTKLFDNTIDRNSSIKNNLPKANLKARLRMCTLYFYANKLNYLVAGTGNKSEDDIGYFTKYGDGGVDFLPIQHLYKHEVRELAKFLNIPDEIINRKPTAGLWQGQTDEDELSKELGFNVTYDELDKMLIKINEGNYDKLDEKYSSLKALMVKNRHKIELPPNLERRTI